jgi:tellurite resistance protein TerC
MQVPVLYWIVFCVVVVAMLLVDMLAFHRRSHAPGLKESALWSAVWISLAMLFNAGLWYVAGPKPAVEFLTGYLLEKSLSVDNLFVFLIIFGYFGVPPQYQYRVLFWGIFAAIVIRLTFILTASQLVHISYVLEIFGLFLIYSGLKLAKADGGELDPDKNWLLRIARRYLRVADGLHGEKFFVRQDGKLMVTVLFLVLVVVESTDVVFAIDSVPAIFGVTNDPFIVFTSNVFAILGLRALYFLLSGVMGLFRYLSYGLSAVLVFIGAKMVAHQWIELPHWVSLSVIAGLLSVSITASLLVSKLEAKRAALNGSQTKKEIHDAMA